MAVDFKLYLITDRGLVPDILLSVEEALKGGVKAVQLREKDMQTRPLLELAYQVRELTLKYNAKLFINDRADIALSVGADGVHLGQNSIPVNALKKTWPGLMAGASAHSLSEALIAERDGADFITLGPVYETPSKLKYGPPVGVGTLRRLKARVGIPVFAIGGIKEDNIEEVMEAGADGVALISGILKSPDIKTKTEEFMRALQ
ncbi:MAG: thiamine phosphate synthase [Thermodesulfovibrionales bacterium]|nr:thiamine phosphate synthase [Thermodesulfovibrionales bacterium]